MPRTAADDVAPFPFPTISPSLLLAVMLRCAFMQLSVMCCIHFTIMLRLVAATVAAAACGAACLCYCFCCGAKRCSLLLLFFFCCFASAIVVVLFVVIISVLRELPPSLVPPASPPSCCLCLFSVAFWYLTFI